MKITQRIRMVVQAVLQEVLEEDLELDDRTQTRPDQNAEDRLTGLLDEAQERVDTLRLELAGASDRQKRIEREWQAALAHSQELNATVDAALRAGQEELARSHLEQTQRAQANARELGELCKSNGQLIFELRAAVEEQQERLDAMRRRYLVLAGRGQRASTMDDFLCLQRDLTRQTAALQMEFQLREEQIARGEDRLAARAEYTARAADRHSIES